MNWEPATIRITRHAFAGAFRVVGFGHGGHECPGRRTN
jgi:hypothetical protein